jgi:hypothetical protein
MFEHLTDLARLIRLFCSLNKQQRGDILRISEAYAQSAK